MASSDSDGLWQRALDSLRPEIRAHLAIVKTHKRDILAAVLRAAEEKRELCLSKRWKFKRPNGDEVILRDVLEKITKWVHLFKGVGDVAVQLDPTAASVPWAAVRFLLQAAVNDVHVFGTMIADLEVISRLIARYRRFELVHLRSRCDGGKKELEDALTGLYAEVLVHLAATVNYFHESTIEVRLAKSTFRLADQEQLQKIAARDAEILKLASITDSELLQSVETAIVRLCDQAALAAKAVDEKTYLDLLRWLSDMPFTHHHELRCESRVPNTGEWLFQSKVFQDWATSSSSLILHLHGIPGSGKSTLCSAVVDSLIAAASKEALAAPFAYVYCADSEAERERSSPEAILRSILRQLAINGRSNNPEVRASLLSSYEQRRAQAKVDAMPMPKLRANDCLRLILDLAAEDPLTIVVDAVDEIKECDRHTLLATLKLLVTDADNVVKVLITSRDDAQIFELLPSARRIRITPEDTRRDVEAFVRQQLDQAVTHKRLLGGNVSPELRSRLQKTLASEAGEIFLWAKLKVDSLCQHKHEDDVINSLSSGFKDAGLSSLYEDALDRILKAGQVAKDTALGTFAWLLFMKESLRAEEFVSAVLVEDQPKLRPSDLANICFNLVVFDNKCNSMRFAHHSFQQFLRTQGLLSPELAHQIIASRCLTITCLGPPDDFDPSMGSLYAYSASYWAIHYGLASPATHDLARQMESFVFDDDGEPSLSFEVWMESAQAIAKALPSSHSMKPALEAIDHPDGTPLFTAAVFGLQDLLEKLCDQPSPPEWNSTNTLGHTALYLASARGNRQAAEFLLRQGADADIDCGTYGSALHVACFWGHVAIVQLLLDHGVSWKSRGKFSDALEAAYLGDQEGVALTLLQGPSPSIISGQEEYDKALQGAAQAGFIKVIDLLQSTRFAALFGKDETRDRTKSRTKKAIQGGQLGVLRRFLQKNQDCRSLLPHDAVALAALYGHDDVMGFLLEKGMDIEEEGVVGSPLRISSLLNHERCVRLLLDHGAKLETTSSFGSALQAASMKGHVRIIRLLVQRGADVNWQGGLYGTALQTAAYHGHQDAVGLLLDAKADLNIEGFSRDAFHAAAEGGQYEIIHYLLGRGYVSPRPLPMRKYRMMGPSLYKYLLRDASPTRVLECGSRKTPVDHGSTAENSSSPRYVGSDIECVLRASGGTDLSDDPHAAVPAGYSRQKKFWLKQKYCLEASAATGHKQIVQTLLEHQGHLDITPTEICDSVIAAAKNHHLEIVEILSHHLSASPMATKALELAIEKITEKSDDGPNTKTVSRLLDRAAEICSPAKLEELQALVSKRRDVKDRYSEAGSSDLSTDRMAADITEACETGDVATMSTILSSSHFDRAIKTAGQTLLRDGFHCAVYHAHEGLVGLFLEHQAGHLHELVSPTVFFVACGNGYLDVVRLLYPVLSENKVALSRGLIAACENAHLGVVQHLARNGADANAVERLVHAPIAGDMEIPEEELVPLPRISPLQAALLEFERYRDEKVERLFGKLRRQRHRGSERKIWHWNATGDRRELEEIVEVLLHHGADPNALGGWVESPLQVAVDIAPLGVVKALVRSGANVNAVGEGQSTLQLAAGRETDCFLAAELLVGAGADLDEEKNEVLRVASSFFSRKGSGYRHPHDGGEGTFFELTSVEGVFTSGPGALIEWLLRRHPSLRADDAQLGLLLQMAAFLDKVALVELLISRGVDVNSTGGYYGTPLQAASRCGHLGVVKCLLEAGADVDIIHGEHHTAVRAALLSANYGVVKLLLDHGADPSLLEDGLKGWRQESHETTLQLAARGGCGAEIMALLLAHGLDAAEEANNSIVHPLIQYAGAGNAEVVQLLIEAGASPNVTGKEENYIGVDFAWCASPLHAASCRGHVDVMQVLLEAGADVDIMRDVEHAGTPLLSAAGSNQVEAIGLLTRSGAHVDVGEGKQTPLAAAAAAGHVEAVEELLKAGARVFEPVDKTVRVPGVACTCDEDEVSLEEEADGGEETDSGSEDGEEPGRGQGNDETRRWKRIARCTGCTGSPPSFGSPTRLENALSAACVAKRSAVVEMLLEHICQSDGAEGPIDEAMELVAETGQEEEFLQLLAYVPLDAKRLRWACAAGSLVAIEYILDSGVDINSLDETQGTPLCVASAHHRVRAVQVLLDCGAGPNRTADGLGGPLVVAMEACANKWLKTLQYRGGRLLAEKLLSIPAPKRFAPWLLEVPPNKPIPGVSVCERIVGILAEAGGRVDAESAIYGPALHLAALLGSESLVDLILGRGVNVETRGGYFETALFAAIEGRHAGVVQRLLDNGADVQHQHPELGTPLQHACRKNSVECLRLLLGRGADPAALDARGRSVLAAALEDQADATGTRNGIDGGPIYLD